MSTPVKTSQIVKDGLRYKAKVSGSPFGETNQYAHTATMSCFLCGKHRPPTHTTDDAQVAGYMAGTGQHQKSDLLLEGGFQIRKA